MVIRIFLLIFFSYTISLKPLSAQKVNEQLFEHQPDQLYIYVDKTFYTSGENIWYKVYLLNEGLDENFSKLIYVDLVNSRGETVVYQKLKVIDRSSFGDIQLPLDIEEGYYYLRAYTNWNRNFNEENNYVIKLPIYSEWKEDEKSSAEPSINEPIYNNEEHVQSVDGNISITSQKLIFKRNELVTINLEVKDKEGNPVSSDLLVKVTESDLIPATRENDIEKRKAVLITDVQNGANKMQHLKEDGLKIKGMVTNISNGKPFSTKFLSIYTAGLSDFNFYEIQDGILDQKLPDFYGTHTLQFHNFNPYEPTVPHVKLQEGSLKLKLPDLINNYPKRSPQIEKYIHYAKLRRKINEVFGVNNNAYENYFENRFYQLKADKSFLMKDYHTLKDVEDFIRTFFLKARISEKEGKKSVRLFNYESNESFMESPWFLLNGYLTRDEDFLLKMELKNVEKLEMFYWNSTLATQFNSFMKRNGVIAIHTRDKGILKPDLDPLNNKEVIGFYNPRKFPHPSPLDNNEKYSNPNFNPLVYWNPNVTTKSDGKTSVSFTTSSSVGYFNIEVVGITSQGEVVKGYYTYHVDFDNQQTINK